MTNDTALKCPCCGGRLAESDRLKAAISRLPKNMRRIVEVLYTRDVMSRRELADSIYFDDPDGGPLDAENTVSATISMSNHRLIRFGWRVSSGAGRGFQGYFLERLELADAT